MAQSKRFSLDLVDWKSIGVGALKVAIGAVLTYITPVITGFDYGIYTPIVMWVFTTGANIVWKWVDGRK